MPASTMLGKPEIRMVEDIEELRVDSQLHALGHRKPFREIEVTPDEIGTAQGVAAEISELAILRVVATGARPVLGSTAETNASGLSHWIVPGCVTPAIGLMLVERDAGNDAGELRSAALHDAVSVGRIGRAQNGERHPAVPEHGPGNLPAVQRVAPTGDSEL